MDILLVSMYPVVGYGLKKMLEQLPLDNLTVTEAEVNSLKDVPVECISDLVVFAIIEPSDSVHKNIHRIETIGSRLPGSKIVVYELGTNSREENVAGYLKSGALGFLNLENGQAGFVDCVEAVSQGRYYVSSQVIGWLVRNYLPVSYSNGWQKDVMRLTKNELEIAEHLTSGKQVTWIAQQSGRKVSTISTIKKRIFEKTRSRNIIELREWLFADS